MKDASKTVLSLFKPLVSKGVSVENTLCGHLPDLPLELITMLIDESVSTFKTLQPLERRPLECIIIGDLHGNIRDLVRILHLFAGGLDLAIAEKSFVFLGDYVDRGINSIEVICLLLSLHNMFPNNVILLRGNHEFANVNNTYGFKEEIQQKYGQLHSDDLNKGSKTQSFSEINKHNINNNTQKSDGNNGKEDNDDKDCCYDLWLHFQHAFSLMPLACTLGDQIFCVHGGISSELKELQQIKEIKLPVKDYSESPLIRNLVWSDPIYTKSDSHVDESDGFVENPRGAGQLFTANNLRTFLETNNLRLIVRAHQAVENGIITFAHRMGLTVFSCSDYMNGKNRCGVLVIKKSGEMRLFSLGKPKEGQAIKPTEKVCLANDGKPGIIRVNKSVHRQQQLSNNKENQQIDQ